MLRSFFAVAVLIFSVTGCQPIPGTPPPTVWPVRIQYTPALETAVKDLTACAAAQPGIGLVTSKLPANLLDPNKADLVLRIGKPAAFNGYAALAGEEEIVLIVNPTNPAQLSLADASSIYSRRIHTWDMIGGKSGPIQPTGQAQPIHAWAYSVGDDLQEAFTALLPGGAEISNRLNIAPGPREMVEAVAADPGAIGFIPRSFADAGVRIIPVTKPGSQIFPRLILSAAQPQGPVRALIACMQHTP